MKHLCILFITHLSINCGFAANGKTDSSVFPKSWDTANYFGGRNIVAWWQVSDTSNSVWTRYCLIFDIGRDSLDSIMYTLSQYECQSIFNFRPYWDMSYISHLIPNRDGFTSNLQVLDYTINYHIQPDYFEIYTLLSKWEFPTYVYSSLNENVGVDIALWTKLFGWRPEEALWLNH